MGLVTLIAAAEESHRSETPFFVVGIALAVFAVLVSVVGFTRPDFPGSEAAARAVMAVGAVLVVLTGGLIVYVAG
jgi:hypothetical protein